MTSDAGEKPFVTLSAERGITTFKAESLEEFLAELDGLETMRNLRVYVSPRGDSRSTTLGLLLGDVNVSVSGEDETWVLGRAEAIKRRLKITQSRWLVPSRVLFSVGVGANVVSIILTFLLKGRARSVAPFIFTLLSLSAWAVLGAQFPLRRSRLELIPKSHSSWSVVERSMTIIVALGTMVIMLFTILLWQLTRK
jgi:hypothetical protein